MVGWIGIYDCFICYKADRLVALNTQLKNVTKAAAVSSLWLTLVSAAFPVSGFDPLNIVVFAALVTLAGILSRILMRVLLLNARRSGHNYRHLLIIGANPRAIQVAEKIENKPELGYKIVGFVAETPEATASWKERINRSWRLLGGLDQLRGILGGRRVDEVAVCLPVDASLSDMATVIKNVRDLGIVVRLIPESADGHLLRNLQIEEFEDEFVVTLCREQPLIQLLVKRGIDAGLSLAVLVVLFPLMAVVAILIKLTSPGPVIFAQDRVGMNQRRFKLYKFRSMVADAERHKAKLLHLNERDGPVFKIANDPRITPLGRFIRRTSIDELPQLFNVLIGEMSLVGPRPPLPEEVKKYKWMFRHRLCVKPGITCIWQVSGRQGVSFDRWMQMDHEYIENWSIWLDLRILLKTIPAVLTSRGAS